MKVSIVIRTLNEERYLEKLLIMISRQKVRDFQVETVLIDSGSTDNTIEIARRYNCKITNIRKEEFSFGRALNRGCDFASGDILVFISGHCVPVDEHWLQDLCQPLIDEKAVYSYGRQIGDHNSNYSETRIFAKYFPENSAIPQNGFFCNNANSALLRSTWSIYPFDEELTGLEDMELAKRLVSEGKKIAYVAEAAVFHHHSESWEQVRRRFEREAIALRTIMPEVQLSRLDLLRYITASVLSDWRSAVNDKGISTSRMDMLRYRWSQYYGSYKGNHEHRRLSQQAKEQFFYPQTTQKALDEQNRTLRRTSSYESQ